ncbi:MAG: type VII secretion protein EsaA [Lactobacillaceae bacterium]|jgi:type VII secretion EsaA-like protein|nr:type VII secretion protein EsaA [Lactobacillaceae bacterium]
MRNIKGNLKIIAVLFFGLLTTGVLVFLVNFANLHTQSVANGQSKKYNFVLVNEDLGSSFQNERYNLGSDFVKKISLDSSNNWSVTSLSVATSLFDEKSADAIIVIPQDFSSKILDLTSYDPAKAQITFKTQDTHKQQTQTLLSNKVHSVLEDFNKKIINLYFAGVLNNLYDAQNKTSNVNQQIQTSNDFLKQSVQNPFNGLPDQYKNNVSAIEGLQSQQESYQQELSSFTNRTNSLLDVTSSNILDNNENISRFLIDLKTDFVGPKQNPDSLDDSDISLNNNLGTFNTNVQTLTSQIKNQVDSLQSQQEKISSQKNDIINTYFNGTMPDTSIQAADLTRNTEAYNQTKASLTKLIESTSVNKPDLSQLNEDVTNIPSNAKDLLNQLHNYRYISDSQFDKLSIQLLAATKYAQENNLSFNGNRILIQDPYTSAINFNKNQIDGLQINRDSNRDIKIYIEPESGLGLKVSNENYLYAFNFWPNFLPDLGFPTNTYTPQFSFSDPSKFENKNFFKYEITTYKTKPWRWPSPSPESPDESTSQTGDDSGSDQSSSLSNNSDSQTDPSQTSSDKSENTKSPDETETSQTDASDSSQTTPTDPSEEPVPEIPADTTQHRPNDSDDTIFGTTEVYVPLRDIDLTELNLDALTNIAEVSSEMYSYFSNPEQSKEKYLSNLPESPRALADEKSFYMQYANPGQLLEHSDLIKLYYEQGMALLQANIAAQQKVDEVLNDKDLNSINSIYIKLNNHENIINRSYTDLLTWYQTSLAFLENGNDDGRKKVEELTASIKKDVTDLKSSEEKIDPLDDQFKSIYEQTKDATTQTDETLKSVNNLASDWDSSSKDTNAYYTNFKNVFSNAKIGGSDNGQLLNFLSNPVTLKNQTETSNSQKSIMPYLLTLLIFGFSLLINVLINKVSYLGEKENWSIPALSLLLSGLTALLFAPNQNRTSLFVFSSLLIISISLLMNYKVRQKFRTPLYIISGLFGIFIILNPVIGVLVSGQSLLTWLANFNPFQIVQNGLTLIELGRNLDWLSWVLLIVISLVVVIVTTYRPNKNNLRGGF